MESNFSNSSIQSNHPSFRSRPLVAVDNMVNTWLLEETSQHNNKKNINLCNHGDSSNHGDREDSFSHGDDVSRDQEDMTLQSLDKSDWKN